MKPNTGTRAMAAVNETHGMANSDWHLDKKVPIAFIFAIVGQTMALVWFFASLSNGVEANTRDIIRQDTRITNLELSVQGQAVTLARIDENLKAIRSLIESSSGGK